MNAKESKEMAVFLAELVNGVDGIGGKWQLIDALGFIQAALAAPAAFTGVKLLPEEFKQWNQEDKAEVIQVFKDRLKFGNQVSQEHAEDIFSHAISLAKSIHSLINK